MRQPPLPRSAGSRPARQVHHVVKRSDGGVTSLENCVLLRSFHHLCAVHQWGRQICSHGQQS